MIKKKAKKKKTVDKKPAKRKSASKKANELHPSEVLKNISLMVEEQAANMAKAVIDVGKTGQLGPVKFLLELAKIFPQPTDGSQGTPEEDSLAKTLLDRLNIPSTPIQHDENGELVPPSPAAETNQLIAGGEKDSGMDSAGNSDAKDTEDPVPA
jgi:hypothetical protein